MTVPADWNRISTELGHKPIDTDHIDDDWTDTCSSLMQTTQLISLFSTSNPDPLLTKLNSVVCREVLDPVRFE